MNELNVRTFDRVYDNVVIRVGTPRTDLPHMETPLHFSGGAFLLHNNSSTVTARVTIADSPNGTVYTAVSFSSWNQSSLLLMDIVPQGLSTILVRSVQPWVRITVTPNIPEGMYFHLVQWQPRAQGADLS